MIRRLLPILGLALCATGARASERLAILQPGYPGSTEEARKFLDELCRFLSRESGVAVSAGEYHNKVEAGLEAIRRHRPSVAIVSLGTFLEHRKGLGLEPILWSQPDAPFHVLVRRGTAKSFAELDGKTLTGTPLLEPEFVERLLLPPEAAKGKPPRLKLVPVQSFSRAVRAVRKGRQDAALLSALELRGLERLRVADEVEVIHTTRALPTAIFVALGERIPEKDAAALAKALAGMPRSDAGKELLRTMGIVGFEPVDRKRLEALERAHDEATPDASP